MESIEEKQVPQIQVDEFLVEAIHIQLENLTIMKYFRYQTYLNNIFFYFNQESFPDLFRVDFMESVIEISFVNKDQN